MQKKMQAEDGPRIEELQRLREQDLVRIAELEKKLVSDTESLRKSQQDEI